MVARKDPITTMAMAIMAESNAGPSLAGELAMVIEFLFMAAEWFDLPLLKGN